MKATQHAILTLLVCVLFFSCQDKVETLEACKCRNDVQTYDNTVVSVDTFTHDNIFDKTVRLGSYLPDLSKMKGVPNSYEEDVSEYPNWSKEDADRIAKESNGLMFADTTDRDFVKYWYNQKGLLCKYSIKNIGDILHEETFFLYDSKDKIVKVVINDVVIEPLAYKHYTVIINPSGTLFLMHHNTLRNTDSMIVEPSK